MNEQPQPFIVVPGSPDFAHIFDRDIVRIRASKRAREVGIVVLMPRSVHPSTLMFAAYMWPQVLKGTGISRVAVALGIAAYATAQPLLGGCARRMLDGGIRVEFFHEGHVEAGAIAAWAERRVRRKRVTTDQLVRICERYAERGDLKSAMLALQIAEESAAIDTVDAPIEELRGRGPTVRMRKSSEEDVGGRITAELVA
jgi:hypothetical protein